MAYWGEVNPVHYSFITALVFIIPWNWCGLKKQCEILWLKVHLYVILEVENEIFVLNDVQFRRLKLK